MFAVSFDLTVADAERHHRKGARRAYADIGEILGKHGFEWIQHSVYASKDGGLTHLFEAISELRALPWFRKAVRDIRAFRMENYSDFTASVKGPSDSDTRPTIQRVKEPAPLYG